MGAGRALVVMALGLSGCGLFQGQDPKNKALDQADAIRIVLNTDQPDLSKGVLYDAKAPLHFNVGFGRQASHVRGAHSRKASRHWELSR